MLVGEVGIDRNVFLFELPLWEINLIIKGHRRRYRDVWEAARWQSYIWLIARGAKGVRDIQDLIVFPWEKKEKGDVPTDDEVEEIREKLRKKNEKEG